MPLSTEEKIKVGIEEKEKGNVKFTSGDPKGALQSYHMAVLYLSGLDQKGIAGIMGQSASGDEEVISGQKQLSLVYSNMAACYIKLENYERVIQIADKANKADPSNIKSKYRKAQALRLGGSLYQAKQLLQQCISQHPDEISFISELAQCDKVIKAKEAQSHNIWKGFLGKKPPTTA